MAAAFGAMHLGAAHAVAVVGRGRDGVVLGCPEGRPAAAAFVLGRRIEQRLAAAGAAELAGALLVVERARSGALGRVLAQHLVLRRVEFLAPLLVALLHGRALCLLAHGSLLHQ